VTGIVGGLIASMLGLGGGIFYILVLPFIMHWYGIPAEEAAPFIIANSIFGIAFASGVSIISQFKNLRSYLREILIIGIPASATSLLATAYIVHSPWFSKEVFNILVIILMIYILIRLQFYKVQSIPKDLLNKEIETKEGSISGSISGLVSAVSGLGGGIIIIPILQIRLKQSMQKAKIISLSIIFMSAVFISLQNLISQANFQAKDLESIGFIIPRIVIPIIIGVFIGSPIGTKLSKHLSEEMLGNLFKLFIILVMIEKAWILFN